mmetsp:Transcript_10632/g.31415  ORF Transcript_10632/g.31415 Transcript_10632/m.31415 type:complete len:318 (+) Transcript_10632:745-1698(+)
MLRLLRRRPRRLGPPPPHRPRRRRRIQSHHRRNRSVHLPRRPRERRLSRPLGQGRTLGTRRDQPLSTRRDRLRPVSAFPRPEVHGGQARAIGSRRRRRQTRRIRQHRRSGQQRRHRIGGIRAGRHVRRGHTARFVRGEDRRRHLQGRLLRVGGRVRGGIHGEFRAVRAGRCGRHRSAVVRFKVGTKDVRAEGRRRSRSDRDVRPGVVRMGRRRPLLRHEVRPGRTSIGHADGGAFPRVGRIRHRPPLRRILDVHARGVRFSILRHGIESRPPRRRLRGSVRSLDVRDAVGMFPPLRGPARRRVAVEERGDEGGGRGG